MMFSLRAAASHGSETKTRRKERGKPIDLPQMKSCLPI